MTKGKALSRYQADLLSAMDAVATYLIAIDKPAFMADKMLQDAVLRNIEVAGEISNNIVKHHEDFALFAEAIDFKGLIGMRNVVLHGYHKVDLDIVWVVASEQFPVIRNDLRIAIDDHAASAEPPSSES